MDKLGPATQAAVDAIDEQIAGYERKLAKVQPLYDELTRLKKARSILIQTSGGASPGSRLTVDMVREQAGEDEAFKVPDMAKRLGDIPQSTLRMHLMRFEGINYERAGDGKWRLLEEDDDQ